MTLDNHEGKISQDQLQQVILTLLPDVQEEAIHHEEGKSCHSWFSSSLVIWREKSPSVLWEQHFCKQKFGD